MLGFEMRSTQIGGGSLPNTPETILPNFPGVLVCQAATAILTPVFIARNEANCRPGA
jgi:hypothetical protein